MEETYYGNKDEGAVNSSRAKVNKERGKKEVTGSYGARQIIELLLETLIEIHEGGK